MKGIGQDFCLSHSNGPLSFVTTSQEAKAQGFLLEPEATLAACQYAEFNQALRQWAAKQKTLMCTQKSAKLSFPVKAVGIYDVKVEANIITKII